MPLCTISSKLEFIGEFIVICTIDKFDLIDWSSETGYNKTQLLFSSEILEASQNSPQRILSESDFLWVYKNYVFAVKNLQWGDNLHHDRIVKSLKTQLDDVLVGISL